MSHTLYIGNLPPSATEQNLRDRFGKSGTVHSAVVVMDAPSGRSRRFGFVEMSSHAEARTAVGRLNMTQFEETVISVSFARVEQRRMIPVGVSEWADQIR